MIGCCWPATRFRCTYNATQRLGRGVDEREEKGRVNGPNLCQAPELEHLTVPTTTRIRHVFGHNTWTPTIPFYFFSFPCPQLAFKAPNKKNPGEKGTGETQPDGREWRSDQLLKPHPLYHLCFPRPPMLFLPFPVLGSIQKKRMRDKCMHDKQRSNDIGR